MRSFGALDIVVGAINSAGAGGRMCSREWDMLSGLARRRGEERRQLIAHRLARNRTHTNHDLLLFVFGHRVDWCIS